MLNALSSPLRERYHLLARVCRDIEKAAGEGDESEFNISADTRLRKIDELMWMYLRLLSMQQSLQTFLETERSEDLAGCVAEAEEEMRTLEAEAKAMSGTAAADSKQRLLESRRDRLQVLRKRAERVTEAEGNLELVLSEQERLAEQIKLIRADAVATKSATAVSARIDASVEHLNETNKWLSEMDQFRDLAGDLPMVPARVGFEAAGRRRCQVRHSPLDRNSVRVSGKSSIMETDTPPDQIETNTPRLPLRRWELEFARRWNGGSYSLFVLHGNIFDVFPVQSGSGVGYVPVRAFLARRLFPERAFLLFYDVADGLTFGTADMQKRFFDWLEIFDQVESTNYRQTGPPREFLKLAPLLRRFFLRVEEEENAPRGVTLIIDFPEKIIPAAEESGASSDERTALVTLLKWAASPEMRREDVGVILITESAAELHADLLQNPHVAQVRIDLPDADERLRFIESGGATNGATLAEWSDLSAAELATRTAG